MKQPLVKYATSLLEGRYLSRHKRFFVEAQLNGRTVWAHTNNTGSMQGLLACGNRVMLSESLNPARKLAYTLELIEAGGVWCGVNTSIPNRMLKAAFAAGRLEFARNYTQLKMEQALPAGLALPGGNSRLDARLGGEGQPDLWVECKNVTLVENGLALFPDAVTQRGHKHLRQLIALKQKGLRAACFFLVQRTDASAFAPAVGIDPEYAALFWEAFACGVEMYPYTGIVSMAGIDLGAPLPLNC